MTTVEPAYGHCVEITRTRAANFYYGIRLLPAVQRRAMCAVYAFARRIDDIGDGSLSVEEKRRELAASRRMLDTLDGQLDDPVLVALADAERSFNLPLEALADLIDGVGMDVEGVDYEVFDDLIQYCRRVAGSIGRLCVAIYGSPDMARAAALGDDLGVALQLTNILRDVREDLGLGRVYLPAADRRRFRCEDLMAADPADVAALVQYEAARAREWYARGLPVLDLLGRRSASSFAAMSGIYLRLLRRIEANPASVLQGRISLSLWEKVGVAARAAVIAR